MLCAPPSSIPESFILIGSAILEIITGFAIPLEPIPEPSALITGVPRCTQSRSTKGTKNQKGENFTNDAVPLFMMFCFLMPRRSPSTGSANTLST